MEAIRLGESDNQADDTGPPTLPRPPDNDGPVEPHVYLGHAHRLKGDLPRAISSYRDAIRINPEKSIEARYSLGVALAESSDEPGAIAAIRDAIQSDDQILPGPFRLLRAITTSARPKSATAALERVRNSASDEKIITRAIELAISQFEQISKQGLNLPTILHLSSQGSNLAEHFYRRRYFTASAAIWSAGFAADSNMADNMQANNRYNAACSAALAAAGKGIDKPPLGEPAKAHWRHHALEWLNADLAHRSKQGEAGSPQVKVLVNKTLQHWKSDTDLASIRDEIELAKLTEPERKDWRALWAEVAALLKKADGH